MNKAAYVPIIRQAINDDLNEIALLFKEQFHLHHTLNPVYYIAGTKELTQVIESYVIKAVNENSPHLLVAEVQKELAGFITFRVETSSYFDSNLKRFGEIIEVYVRPNHRQLGLGKQLIREAEDYFQEQNCLFVRLATCSSNEAAAIFYDHLGYKDTLHIRIKQLGNT